MKRILICLFVLIVSGISVFAQCDQKVVWTAPKADFADEAGNVTETKDVKVVIRTNKKEIKITHSDDETDTLQGLIKEVTCNWKDAFKNGKTVMKVDLSDRNTQMMNSIITIEAKDSKILVSILAEIPDGTKKMIKIPVDSYKVE
ncbi:MAG TPA: hypothetical protein VMI12_00810 [Puia sp.]|nr:hypothetical protein [Puia sp.]